MFNLGDFLTSDEPTWIRRANGFLRSLVSLNLGGTFQAQTEYASHPGVTVMWLGSVGVVLSSIVHHVTYLPVNVYIFLLKLPLILFSAILFVVDVLILTFLFDLPAVFLIGVFIALDPFILAYTKLFHVDGLLSLLIFTSILTFIFALKKKNEKYIVFSGIFTGLSVLTKVPAISLIPVIFLMALIDVVPKKKNLNFKHLEEIKNSFAILFSKINLHKAIKLCFPWALAALVTFIILWPAVWVDPVKSIGSLVGATEKGMLAGHKTTEYIFNPLFYLQSLLYFTSPLILVLFFVGSSLMFVKKIKNKQVILISLFFVLFFIIGMSLGAKKGERYILPVYPFIDVIAALGFYQIITHLKSKGSIFRNILYCLPILFLIFQAIQVQPYYLAYYDPLLPRPVKIGFGEGLEQAANYLNSKDHSENLKVASWYPDVFTYYFKGKTENLDHRWDSDVSYVVLYRGMQGRPEDDSATQILNEFQRLKPEKIIYINGLTYVWIYRMK